MDGKISTHEPSRRMGFSPLCVSVAAMDCKAEASLHERLEIFNASRYSYLLESFYLSHERTYLLISCTFLLC